MKRLLYLLCFLPFHTYAQHDCEALERQVDKFTGKVTISTPILEPITYYKYPSKAGTTYILRLNAYGSTVETRGKGVIILLEGGKRINKPTLSIDVDAGGDAYEYSAWIKLTPADISLLKAHKITDYRLYIYDSDLEDITKDRALDWFNCLLLAK